jgi:uncharacterized repeat protein (TIGR01451 family)
MTATSSPSFGRVYRWLQPVRTLRVAQRNGCSIAPRARLAVAAMLLGLLCTSHPVVRAQVAPYTFYQTHPNFSPATDVSDDGTVVGYWFGPPVSSDPNTNSRGYVWTRESGAQPIITDPATVNKFPVLTAVNDPTGIMRINGTGTIAGVGCVLEFCGGAQAAIWNSSDGLLILGSFDNNSQASAPAGINDASQVVGYSWGGGYNNFGPFIWSDTQGLQHLTGFNGLNGFAMGINEDGVVVGAKGTGTRNVAFVWSAAAGQTDIPDIPGATTTLGFAINDSSVVVGRYLAADNTTYRVFRWSAISGTEDLNAPAGYAELLDINNAGHIIATIAAVPYLYKNGTWTNLNDLMPPGTGFTLQFAEAINNNGWIVGVGTTDPNGAQLGQGFVLIPPAEADLGVTKTDSPDPVAVGATLTYTVAVTNSGPEMATEVTLTDTLPAGVTFVSITTTQGTCSGTGTLTCSLGMLGSGEMATIAIEVTPTAPGVITNTASVSAATADPVPDNNTAAVTTVVSPPSTCAANVTGSVTIIPSGPVIFNPRSGTYVQTVSLKVNGAPIQGPVSFVLDNLTAGATVVGAAGMTVCASPVGSPYVNVSIGPDGVMSMGERISVKLAFQAPIGTTITYTPRILAGPGTR